MVLGASLGCSLTACQVHKAQLPSAHAPIGQIPALHHDANNEMGTGTLHIHLLGNTPQKKALNGLWIIRVSTDYYIPLLIDLQVSILVN